MSMQNEKKVILITGSSSGFGLLTAKTTAMEGHTVFASMRNPEGRNKNAKNELESFSQSNGLDLLVIDMDITQDKSVQKAIDSIIERNKRLDVLVNNAGIMNSGISEAFTIEQVQQQIDTNFVGCFRTSKFVLPHMRKQKSGLLIHLSSIAGRAVFPFFGIYCASKFAVEAMAESFRYELFNFGIDSVIVEPGPFKTSLINNAPRPDDNDIASTYGEQSQAAEAMLKAFEDGFKEDTALSPQKVVDEINGLINMEFGSRPLRTIVSTNDFGLIQYNKTASPYQDDILRAMGMEYVLQV